MTAVEQQRVQELDSGHVAVLGHTILAAISVVAGATETLREVGDTLSAQGKAVLDREIDRCVAVIVETCRSLIRGETSSDGPTPLHSTTGQRQDLAG